MKPQRIEVWNLYQQSSRSRYCGCFTDTDMPAAIQRAMEQGRRRLRVRRFYDRTDRRWIIQLLCGKGLACR